MSKRFCATEIWEEDWFLEMPIEYRMFWNYIKDKCDHAGIFRPNVTNFNKSIENKITTGQALKYFNKDKKRIRLLKNGRWFIEDFIPFQYGNHLNSNNRVHASIISLLAQNGVKLTSIRSLFDHTQGVKDKDIDKEKDINTAKQKKSCENHCGKLATKTMGLWHVCSDECYKEIISKES